MAKHHHMNRCAKHFFFINPYLHTTMALTSTELELLLVAAVA